MVPVDGDVGEVVEELVVDIEGELDDDGDDDELGSGPVTVGSGPVSVGLAEGLAEGPLVPDVPEGPDVSVAEGGPADEVTPSVVGDDVEDDDEDDEGDDVTEGGGGSPLEDDDFEDDGMTVTWGSWILNSANGNGNFILTPGNRLRCPNPSSPLLNKARRCSGCKSSANFAIKYRPCLEVSSGII